MKRTVHYCMIIVLTMLTLQLAGMDKKKHSNGNDTTGYISISGKIVDVELKKPVAFASVSLIGTSIATVSNNDGEFILKIKKDIETENISFSHIGYENNDLSISELKANELIIELRPITLPIDEVVVRSVDPVVLIKEALSKIKDNYPSTPEMQTSFYREAIKQNRKYVSVSEAVLDVYKASYTSEFDTDRLKIYKGRKSRNVKKMDTLVVKLQGGPNTSLLLDIVKNPGDLLSEDVLQYYNFTLNGVTSIDNRKVFQINFDQKDNVPYPLYKGSIYIDSEDTAIASIDFGLSDKGLPYASKYFIKKKPSNLEINVEKGHYLIRYQKDNNNWHLNYVRSEINFATKWKKKLFKSKYSLMLEMAVTNRDKENIEKYGIRESTKLKDIFSDQVGFYEDENYWGDYNTIKPDESIEVAIRKLNKQLKQR